MARRGRPTDTLDFAGHRVTFTPLTRGRYKRIAALDSVERRVTEVLRRAIGDELPDGLAATLAARPHLVYELGGVILDRSKAGWTP
jgi:hypothetical protein